MQAIGLGYFAFGGPWIEMRKWGSVAKVDLRHLLTEGKHKLTILAYRFDRHTGTGTYLSRENAHPN